MRKSNTKTGYKVVFVSRVRRNARVSALAPVPYEGYRKRKWVTVPRRWGPFHVFADLESALRFLWGTRVFFPPAAFEVWQVEYKPWNRPLPRRLGEPIWGWQIGDGWAYALYLSEISKPSRIRLARAVKLVSEIPHETVMAYRHLEAGAKGSQAD